MERLSGLDASFLYMETRTMRMQVAFILVCDTKSTPGGYSFQKVVNLLEARTQSEPAFRRRLVEIPFNLHHPIWIDDPEFDILNHVHQYTLPEPGSMRDLGKMIGHIIGQPLDRKRPLWEAWVMEGLENSKMALVIKIHHAAVDGVSGTELIRKLFDDTPFYKPATLETTHKGEPVPSDLELVTYALRSRAGSPKRFLKLLSKSVSSINSMVKKHSKPSNVQRSVPMTAPRTHFNKRIGTRRDIAFAELSLAEIKAIKNATKTTVNDVVLAVCGGVLRKYLQNHNDLPEKSLISMVPISVLNSDQRTQTNNQVSGMWATLATHVEDPLERIKLIHADTQAAKEDFDAIGATLLQDWAEFNTPGAFNLAVRLYTTMGFVERFAPVHNTIISNVPGPRETLYLAGSKIEALYPLGPVMEGVGVNISLASYKDRVCFSIQVDSGLVNDVGEIAYLFTPAFKELKAAAQKLLDTEKRAVAV